ncbi:MAG: hypothetical protein GY760_24870 [Deltaproteobacteria bacterium]|nr:hypothetical protein [Deltaproteobacteria bacterium]
MNEMFINDIINVNFVKAESSIDPINTEDSVEISQDLSENSLGKTYTEDLDQPVPVIRLVKEKI